MENLMQKITSLAKRRGFIYPSSEIYGGVEGCWDYGPLGSLLKWNIKKLWIETFVQKRDDVVLIDGTVIMHPKVWHASGHVEGFTDPLVECKECHKRYRADHMEESEYVGQGKAEEKNQCPNCGSKNLTEAKIFNLMFRTFIGPVEDEASQTYLRPETAQSMFTNFKNILNSSRMKIPFGIAQVGRCFRNEITAGNYTFRSREFEIAEIEYFVKPGTDEEWFEVWVDEWEKFFLDLGLRKEKLRRYEHKKEDLAHYSKRTIDIEYDFPFGWSELAGIANRTDYDLKQHSEFSGEDLSYFDEETKEKYIPYVVEPTLGVERLLLSLLVDAYQEFPGGRSKVEEEDKEEKEDVEVVLKLHKRLAPVTVAVLPLVRNKEEIVAKAKEVNNLLKPYFITQYDETGSIGRRYRRQDEIGTPYCLTIDFDTLNDGKVTIRDRDTMEQERVRIEELPEKIEKYLRS